MDLWELEDLVDAGRLAEARAMLVEPILGPYASRPWALAASAALRDRVGPTAASTPGARRRDGVALARLVGRRRELAALRDAHRRSRLVTVVGLGGVGKSRLVAELVGEVDGPVSRADLGLASRPLRRPAGGRAGGRRRRRRDGARGHRRPAGGHHVGAGPRRLRARPRRSGRHHPVPAAAVPEAVGAGDIRVALGLGRAGGALLPFADPSDPLGDGVELVLERLRAIGLPFDAGDRDRAAAICERCAGMPLAIELAAAEVLGGQVVLSAGDGPMAAVSAVVEQAVGGLSPATAVAARRRDVAVGRHPDGAGPAPRRWGGGRRPRPPRRRARRGRRYRGAATAPLPPTRCVDALLGRCEPADLVAAAAALGELAARVRPEVDQAPALGPLADAIAEITNAHGLLESLGHAGRPGAPGAGPGLQRGLAGGRALAHRQQPRAGLDQRGGARTSGAAVRARAVFYIVTVAGTYEVASRWSMSSHAMAEVALRAGQPELATAMRMQEANGLGYAGRTAEAWAAMRGVEEAAAAGSSPTVHFYVESVLAASHLIGGDPLRLAGAGSGGGAGRRARRPQRRRPPRRLASIAARTAGDLPLALAEAEIGEEQALTGLARGTLAIVRGEIADLRFVLDPASAPPALRTALATASGAGQLRMAGVCRLRLGLLEDDRAAVSAAAVDLLAVDARWSALALSHLVEGRPATDRFRQLVVRGIGSLTWGMPLSADDQRRVEGSRRPAWTRAGRLEGDPGGRAARHPALRSVGSRICTGSARSEGDSCTAEFVGVPS